MYIRKTNNEYKHYDIAMEEDSKLFRIYESETSICLSCRYNNFHSFSVIYFVIKEEHATLYPIFLEFYERIIEIQKRQSELPKKKWNSLVVGEEGITVLSDSSSLKPNVFRIQKRGNYFVLYFINEEKEMEVKRGGAREATTQIHINKKGSKLDEFVEPFFHLFQSLQEISNTKLGEEKLRLLLSSKDK